MPEHVLMSENERAMAEFGLRAVGGVNLGEAVGEFDALDDQGTGKKTLAVPGSAQRHGELA